MENGKICPKCYGKECTKNGIVKNKQRYRCKKCKYNFTRSTCWKYSDEIRQKAIKLYLEGNGFRRIERLIHVSHMSVINWVRQLASKIQKIPEEEPYKLASCDFLVHTDFAEINLSALR